ncbi:hypothetical protein Sjap_023685 [Stephania japonica]|uniref:Uncharacterized protein n=1 Tax=Stephania japonica TaxID=461633 RepID=A0AAP0HJ71_9MAGN
MLCFYIKGKLFYIKFIFKILFNHSLHFLPYYNSCHDNSMQGCVLYIIIRQFLFGDLKSEYFTLYIFSPYGVIHKGNAPKGSK